MSAQEHEPEVGHIRSRLDMKMEYPAGLYLGEWLRKLTEEERLLALRCRGCGRLLFPPQCVCTSCHAENVEDLDWVDVGPEGTLLLWIAIKMPWLDPRTLECVEVLCIVTGLILLCIYIHNNEKFGSPKSWIDFTL